MELAEDFDSPAQLTALGNPKLLERTSAGLKAIEGLFADFDLNKDQHITHEEFNEVIQLPNHEEALCCLHLSSG